MKEDDEGLISRKPSPSPLAFLATAMVFGRPGLWAAEKTKVIVNSVYVETVNTASKDAEDAVSKAPAAFAIPAAVLGMKKGAVKGVIKGLRKGMLKKVKFIRW